MPTRRQLVLFLILWINVLGSIFGYYYYQSQLSATPAYLWLFVPDCPLYTTLFAILILLSLLEIRSDLFGLIVSIGLMKYGAWTLFILSFFNAFYFQTAFYITLQAAILFILHIGMTAEGFTFPFSKIRPRHLAIALGWFLVNDLLDYFGPSVHPFIPAGGSITLVMLATFAMTLFFIWLTAWLHGKGKRIDVGLAPPAAQPREPATKATATTTRRHISSRARPGRRQARR